MSYRKVRYFYKEGDHASEVVSKAIIDVGLENPDEYNNHDFWHLEDEAFSYMRDKYPHDRVPCMYYKDRKLFEAEDGISDEELVTAVRRIYDEIKDLPY